MFNMGNLRRGLMGTPMAPEYGTSFDQVNGDGGMDVLGSLKKHSNFATQFQSNPTGGMGGGFGPFGGGTGGMNYGGY
jgi:hypothetical protein